MDEICSTEKHETAAGWGQPWAREKAERSLWNTHFFFFLGEDGNGRGFEGHPIGSERTSKKCEGERPVFDWFGPHVCASLSRGL